MKVSTLKVYPEQIGYEKVPFGPEICLTGDIKWKRRESWKGTFGDSVKTDRKF